MNDRFVFALVGEHLLAFPWTQVASLSSSDDAALIGKDDLFFITQQPLPSGEHYLLIDSQAERAWKVSRALCFSAITVESYAEAPQAIRAEGGIIAGVIACSGAVHPRLAPYPLAWVVDMDELRASAPDQFSFDHLASVDSNSSSQVPF